MTGDGDAKVVEGRLSADSEVQNRQGGLRQQNRAEVDALCLRMSSWASVHQLSRRLPAPATPAPYSSTQVYVVLKGKGHDKLYTNPA